MSSVSWRNKSAPDLLSWTTHVPNAKKECLFQTKNVLRSLPRIWMAMCSSASDKRKCSLCWVARMKANDQWFRPKTGDDFGFQHRAPWFHPLRLKGVARCDFGMRKLSLGQMSPEWSKIHRKNPKKHHLWLETASWPLALAVSRWFFLRFLVFSCCALRSFKVKFGGLDLGCFKGIESAFRAASHFASLRPSG